MQERRLSKQSEEKVEKILIEGWKLARRQAYVTGPDVTNEPAQPREQKC